MELKHQTLLLGYLIRDILDCFGKEGEEDASFASQDPFESLFDGEREAGSDLPIVTASSAAEEPASSVERLPGTAEESKNLADVFDESARHDATI